MNRIQKPVVLITSLILGLVSFSGCGDVRPDFEEVIDKATKATNELQSYRMEMVNDQIEEGELKQSSSLIEYVAPDRMHQVSRQLPGNTINNESIQIGTIQYTLGTNSNEWSSKDWDDERMSVQNLAAGMILTLDELVEIEELGDEKVNGIDCFHYTGSLNLNGQQEEQLASLDESDPDYEMRKQMYDSIRYTRDDVEFWISKGDYLLRQYVMNMEVSEYKDKGEDTQEVEISGTTMTCTFTGFNEPIQIEPPLMEPFEGIRIKTRVWEIDTDNNDPEHQLMNYQITASNEGTETASNLRLFVDTKITNEGLQTFEAKADNMPVSLQADEAVIYNVSWEFNLLTLTKEKFIEYHRNNTLRATWTDTDGMQHEEVLIAGE